MTSQPGPFESEDLRALVREVLREALPDVPPSGLTAGTAGPPGTAPDAGNEQDPDETAGDGTQEWVVVDGDNDLTELVRTVARQCRDAARRERLADGLVRYRLVQAPPAAAEPDRPVLRVERGAITERHVRAAGQSGATIVAAKGVVVTPLARDRARSTGVDIEKEH